MSSDVAELERPAGNLPDGWREVVLSDVAEVNPDTLRASTKPDFAFGYIDISQIDGPGQCAGWTEQTFGEAPSRARRRVRAGDVLVSTVRPYLRSFAQVPPASLPLVASTGFAVVRASGESDQQFLYQHILHASFIDHLTPRMTGSNYPAVSASDVEAYPIDLPPLDEQRRIAEVLRSVDEAIAAADAAASSAENLLIRVRDETILQPKWDTTTLADATSAGLFTDGDWVESKDQDPNGDVRLIQLADIGDGFFVDKSRRYLTMEKAHQLRCTFLEEGDLLIARMPDPLGRCCLFPDISQPSVTVVDVCVVRASQITSNRYLNHAIATSDFRSQVLACASGTTRSRVSRGNLGRLELAMPPLAEQEAIAAELDQISIVAGEQRQAAERLRDLKQGLMSDLLSGRVRVPA